jgi:hypothetical protein
MCFPVYQVVLARTLPVARLAHRSPQQRISPSKESRTTQIGNPKTQENRDEHRAFLQNRILVQIKSPRSINDFRILHGRPTAIPVVHAYCSRRASDFSWATRIYEPFPTRALAITTVRSEADLLQETPRCAILRTALRDDPAIGIRSLDGINDG